MALSHNFVHHLDDFLAVFDGFFVAIVAAVPEGESAQPVEQFLHQGLATEIVDDGQQADEK